MHVWIVRQREVAQSHREAVSERDPQMYPRLGTLTHFSAVTRTRQSNRGGHTHHTDTGHTCALTHTHAVIHGLQERPCAP